MDCPGDCGTCAIPVCDDGTCDLGEDCDSCAPDCGICPAVCNDGVCDLLQEDCASCPGDCGGCVCGDGDCFGESCATCELDCGACPPSTCGDLVCDLGEDCLACASDCGSCVQGCDNDGSCDPWGGETCTSCLDCDTAALVCGNGECSAGEDAVSCPMDCGPSPWPAPWDAWEAQVVTEINGWRAVGYTCASGFHPPVGPVTMNPQLQLAARLHSWDQAYSGYFAHDSCNGRSPWDRAADVGTNAYGETIAWGYTSPAAAVLGWMNSATGHCDILMDGAHTEVGAGYAYVDAHLWTGLFR